MGACASNSKTSSSLSSGSGSAGKKSLGVGVGGRSANMRGLSLTTSWSASASASAKVVVVVDMDGGVEEFRQLPVQVKSIVSKNPDCFVCSCESMSIGGCVPRLGEDEELQPGQIYFLLPLSLSNKPLSLPQLCSLAVKAATGLGLGKGKGKGKHTTGTRLQLSSTRSNFILS